MINTKLEEFTSVEVENLQVSEEWNGIDRVDKK